MKHAKTISTYGKTQKIPQQLKDMNVNVRQIDNGYLVHHSGIHKGKHIEKTHFSRTNPIRNSITKGL